MANAQVADTPGPDPRRKLDQAVIAAKPTRHYRAELFQAYVLIASAVFVGLAVGAHFVPYFAVDLRVTHAVQNIQSHAFDQLMYGMSWIGFTPQAPELGAAVVLALYFAGLRWEAVCTAVAGAGVGVGTLVKLIVYRPRPSANLVHVIRLLPSSGFPSGHVLMITTLGGFLGFLAFTLLKPSAGRTALLVACGVVLALMGLSRIDLGQHWFSDVMGAYMLGSLWLALTVRIYRWGKPRYFPRQPVAPEQPQAPVPAVAR